MMVDKEGLNIRSLIVLEKHMEQKNCLPSGVQLLQLQQERHSSEPEVDPELENLHDVSSEWLCSWHLFLNGAVEGEGFAPETAGAGAKKIDGPSFPFETLPSLVITDDMNDELDETRKLSFANSISALFGFDAKALGLVKSRSCCVAGIGRNSTRSESKGR
ncbi:hypothetical protein ACFX13_013058 [Malus domestica]